MSDRKQSPRDHPKTKRDRKPKNEETRENADQAPGELLEGQGDPGLSIIGGGGHA
jgi:hypothetical protein